MSSREIEVILSRQLADCLSVPIFITDPGGGLLFFNKSAESLLGRRFEDTGPMPAEEWAAAFKPHDQNENLLAPDQLPLVQTLNTQNPAHGSFWIYSLTGERHELFVTSLPIIGRAERFLGAMAIFWKT